MFSIARSALTNGFRNAGLGSVADFCSRTTPMTEDGWQVVDTGGGCSALLWEFEAHGCPFYVMLTDQGGADRPEVDDWMLGVHEGKWGADARDNERCVFETDSVIWSTPSKVFAQVSVACRAALSGQVTDAVREIIAARLSSSPAGWSGAHHGSSGYVLSQRIEVARSQRTEPVRQQYELLLGDDSLAGFPTEGDWHLRVTNVTDEANPVLLAEVSYEAFLRLQPPSWPLMAHVREAIAAALASAGEKDLARYASQLPLHETEWDQREGVLSLSLAGGKHPVNIEVSPLTDGRSTPSADDWKVVAWQTERTDEGVRRSQIASAYSDRFEPSTVAPAATNPVDLAP